MHQKLAGFEIYFMNNSEKLDEKKNGLSERLEKACEGIIYLSETDAAVEPFFGGTVEELNHKTFLKAVGKEEQAQAEEADAGQFFDRVTKTHDWHTTSQKKNAEKFMVLRKLLESNLSGLRVFRIGRIKIDIYIVGIDEDGNLAGVKTHAVET